MDNFNNRIMDDMHDSTTDAIMDSITTITMPDDMANALLENCMNIKHSKKLLFRYSKLIAAALVLAFSMVICTTSYAAYNLYQTRHLVVFFEYGIEQEKLDDIGRKINAIPGVASIHFENADDAWASFQEQFFTEDMQDLFSENPLKDSFNYDITIKLDANTEEIREQIEAMDGVRRVKNYNELKDAENMY